MLLFLLFLACHSVSLPLGTWRIEGDNEIGVIRHSRTGWTHQIELALFTEHTSTNGLVEATVETLDGTHWLRFPIQSGFGDGQASIRLQGREAYLPLGARFNEFGIRMRIHSDQTLSDEELKVAHEAWKKRQAIDNQVWMQGSFLLYSDQKPVGTVQLLPDEPAEIRVFDSFWLSDGQVSAERFDEGPDIMLLFPVEPSFEGEDGLLRINTILQEVVVPTSDVPSDLDRRLKLLPGVFKESDVLPLIEASIEEANQLEAQLILRDGIQLSRWASQSDGCASFDDWVMNSGYDWMGYEVKIVHENNECVVYVKGDPEQHRRRFSGKITKNGLSGSEIGD